MVRLSRNKGEDTRAEQSRVVKNKINRQPQPTARTGRHEAAKKALPLRRGKGR